MRLENTIRFMARALPSGSRIHAIGRSGVRRVLSHALVIVGACFLAVTIGAYSWMAAEQHHLRTIEYKARSAPGFKTESNALVQPSANENVTMLSIPKIHLQAAVLEGTDRRTLLLAPGHLRKTALPGDPGNSVIAGHRDTFFRHVYELNPGDEIVVQRAGRQYRYVVSSKSIVGPHDTWIAGPTHDTRLTLVTCYPTYYIGPAPERAIVIAKPQAEVDSLAGQTGDNPKPQL